MNRRPHYRYNPYKGDYELSSIHALLVAKELLATMAILLVRMGHIERTPFIPSPDNYHFMIAGDELCGYIIHELRMVAMNYYDLWMFRSLLRGMIYISLGFDIDEGFTHETT